ncbi:MAG: hypothetical protein JNK20_01045 [Flavipsychrobacter sp.]|nr:hypothetical protein [Flavipsychrobacter sp.]
MKKVKFLGALITLLLTTVTFSLFAQSTGHGGPPHGGVMVDVDNYHIEMVKGQGVLTFYVLDAQAKPLNKSAVGTVEFVSDNGAKTTAKLSVEKAGALKVSLPKSGVQSNCTVTILVDKKTLVGKFKNLVPESDDSHGHQH